MSDIDSSDIDSRAGGVHARDTGDVGNVRDGGDVEDRQEPQTDGQQPEAPARRFEVLFGGGGDPLVFGLPVFVSGSLVLGFALIGMVPVPQSLGSVLAETTFATGLGEFVTALWAIGLGQSIVAAIFGLFAAFWFSLFAVLLGGPTPVDSGIGFN